MTVPLIGIGLVALAGGPWWALVGLALFFFGWRPAQWAVRRKGAA